VKKLKKSVLVADQWSCNEWLGNY